MIGASRFVWRVRCRARGGPGPRRGVSGAPPLPRPLRGLPGEPPTPQPLLGRLAAVLRPRPLLGLLAGLLLTQPLAAQLGGTGERAVPPTGPASSERSSPVPRPPADAHPFPVLCAAAQDAVFQGMLSPTGEGRLRELHRAQALARDATRALPQGAEGHYLLAVALGLEIDHVGAREKIHLAQEIHREATAALEVEPDHPGAHHVLGRLHAGVMRMPGMLRFMARRLLGGEALRDASWERAEAHLKHAEEARPDVIAHHLELGILYVLQERIPAALEEMEHVLALPASLPPDPFYQIQALRLRDALLTGKLPEDPSSFIDPAEVARAEITLAASNRRGPALPPPELPR